MRIIDKPLFIPDITTKEHIDNLTNTTNELSTIEVANLIIKFSVDYICGFLKVRGYTQPYSFDFLEKILKESQSDLKSMSNRILALTQEKEEKKYIKKSIYDISYQVSMLIDFPKTLAIFLDIAGRKLVKKDDKYYGLDLGTGSGILLLAQYIQARRNGFKDENITNIGIEINKYAGEISNILALNLGYGKVICGNTTSIEMILNLGLPRLDFVSNENIPFPEANLIKEPFVKNLSTLRSTGFNLEEISFFPESVWIENLFSQKELKLNDKKNLLFFIKLISKNKDFKLKYITINGKKNHLSNIGREHILKWLSGEGIFETDLQLERRW